MEPLAENDQLHLQQSESPQPPRNIQWLITGGVLVAVIALTGAGYYLVQKEPLKEQQITVSEFIASLTPKIQQEQDPSKHAALKRMYAIGLFLKERTLKDGSSKEGFGLLRSIAEDKSYPKAERALAVQLMGDTFLNYYDAASTTARALIFVDEPFASMWNGDLRTSIRNLYEYSAQLSPSAITEYRIAETYAQDALEKTDSAQTIALTEAVKYWNRGNALLDSLDNATSDDPTDDYLYGYGLRLRGATAYFGIYQATRDEAYVEEAFGSLKNSREELVRSFQEGKRFMFPIFASELMWTDLYYVPFLTLEKGQEGRELVGALNIISEMKSIYGSTSKGFWAQVRNLTYPFAPSREQIESQYSLLSGINNTADTFLQELLEKEDLE